VRDFRNIQFFGKSPVELCDGFYLIFPAKFHNVTAKIDFFMGFIHQTQILEVKRTINPVPNSPDYDGGLITRSFSVEYFFKAFFGVS
jgi:hypothetical protein